MGPARDDPHPRRLRNELSSHETQRRARDRRADDPAARAQVADAVAEERRRDRDMLQHFEQRHDVGLANSGGGEVFDGAVEVGEFGR